MRKFSFFLVSLLCLCASTMWGYTGSNPLNGGRFYIYHPNTGLFLTSTNNKLEMTITPELWYINITNTANNVATANIYHYIDGNPYCFKLDNSGNSYQPVIRSGATSETINIKSSDTGDNKNKIFRSDGTRYVTYDGTNVGPNNVSGDNNDWLFIQESELQYIQTLLPSASGWSQLTSLPANLDDYYYCFVDNAQPLMVKMATGSHNTYNKKAQLTLYYDEPVNPLDNLDYLWTITSNSSYSCQSFKNVKNNIYYVQTHYNAQWYIQLYDQPNVCEWTQFLFEYDNTNHWWTIKNNRFTSNNYYLGPWEKTYNYSNFVPGLEFCGNNGENGSDHYADYVGHFQIYAIKKDAQLFNSDFSSDPWYFGWSGTGSNKASAFVNQSNNGNFTGTFAEMWKDNKLEADGDIYQSVSLPAGYYKLKAKVVSSNIYSTLYAKVGNTEYNDWFTGSGTSAGRAIVFYVPSTTSVRVGYKTRNHDSSASSDTWVAVDDFSLTSISKLDVNINGSGDFVENAVSINVEDEISSAFTFAYSDGDIVIPTPTSSSSDEFYYTITTNTISSIKTGCDGDHTNDVITYDPSTNTIKAWNAGTATITFTHVGTDVVTAKEVSFNIIVSKFVNPITVTLDGNSRNAMNVGYGQADITLAYTSPNNSSEYFVNHRNGGDNAVTLSNDYSTLSLVTPNIEGVDYWDITQAENYKYEAGSAFVRIQVNKVAETESYLHQGLMNDGESHKISDSQYVIENLGYSPLYITYVAWSSGAAIAQKSVCEWYDENGTKLGSKSESIGDSHALKTVDLPENARKIIITDSGWGAKYISNVQVVRRTYVDASVEANDLGTVYVGNTATTTLNIEWGTSNGGNLTVESDNDRFAVSAESVVVSANSNGSTSLTITYTPNNGHIGLDEVTISVRDTYHFEHITISATAALKEKELIYGYGLLYNGTRNIQIDDEDTKAYDATYVELTNTVTLNELTASDDKALIIPAGNVVLLYKAGDNATPSSTIKYEYTTNATNVSVSNNNCFVHHNGTTPDGYVNYVLAKQGDDPVSFYLYNGEQSLSGYNVLQLPSGAAGAPSIIRIVTEDNTATALVPVYEENSAAGQKVNSKKILIEGHLYIQQGNNLYDALGRKVQ